MNLTGGLIGSAIGGVVGAALWAGITYGTGYEIGWIAWGVGGLAGLGMAVGSKSGAGQVGGVIAALIAIVAILAGKYWAVDLIMNRELSKSHIANITDADIPGADDGAHWTSFIADQIIEEREKAGKTVKWPEGVNPEEAATEQEYPKDVWTDAAKRWKAMSPADRTKFRDDSAAYTIQQANAFLAAAKSQVRSEGFWSTFGVFDLIFGFLAIGTAFKLGSGDIGGS
jgi:hypothetical protein